MVWQGFNYRKKESKFIHRIGSFIPWEHVSNSSLKYYAIFSEAYLFLYYHQLSKFSKYLYSFVFDEEALIFAN